MEYLYHYTSLDTLALILSNKTICFNNLLNVDDIEEAETEDMGRFGKFVYVSCWTDDNEESIPLWNLYTPNMHGVRIRMPRLPFKKYHYNKGMYFFTEDVDTYINFEKIYNEDKVSIVANQPELIEVEYTNDEKKLYPKVRYTSQSENTLERTYQFLSIGAYKRKNWSFQREWRYKISISPVGLKQSNPSTLQKQLDLIIKLEDDSLEVPYQRLYLDIDESAFEKMEIVFGPRMSDSEKILAKSLIKEYCPPTCAYRDSSLKIR